MGASDRGYGTGRYHVQTWGCQMNVLDSDKLSGALERHGFVRAADAADADVLLLNTCSIREKHEWPGRIGGSLVSRGRVSADGADAVVEIGAIVGRLRDCPVKLTAAAQIARNALAVEQLTLSSGNARIEAAGSVADTLDLRWSVNAPDLAQLLPDAAGTLKGDGRVTGSREQPRLVAKLEGSALRFRDRGVARLALDTDLGVAADAPLRLDLAASGIAAAGMVIGDLAAKANAHVCHLPRLGSRQGHRCQQGPELDLARRGRAVLPADGRPADRGDAPPRRGLEWLRRDAPVLRGHEPARRTTERRTARGELQGAVADDQWLRRQMWPSAWGADLVVNRLRAKGHPHPYGHLALPDTGHVTPLPNTVTTFTPAIYHSLLNVFLTCGGNPAATARTSRQTRQAMVAHYRAVFGH